MDKRRKRTKTNPYPPLDFLRPMIVIKWLAYSAILLAIWLGFNYSVLRDYFDARALRNENRRAVAELNRQVSSLLEEKAQLETWGFSAEKAIRERFKMIRPGEKVILLDPPPPSSFERDSPQNVD